MNILISLFFLYFSGCPNNVWYILSHEVLWQLATKALSGRKIQLFRCWSVAAHSLEMFARRWPRYPLWLSSPTNPVFKNAIYGHVKWMISLIWTSTPAQYIYCLFYYFFLASLPIRRANQLLKLSMSAEAFHVGKQAFILIFIFVCLLTSMQLIALCIYLLG